MIPVLAYFGLILLGGVALGSILKSISGDPELSEIDDNDIYQDFMEDDEEEDLSETVIKQRITRSINKLVKDCEGFKIGKTGNPKTRNRQHHTYQTMFVLCKSKDGDFIEDLEAHYNDKYINHEKNDNHRAGSAGKAVPAGKYYYLYVVLR